MADDKKEQARKMAMSMSGASGYGIDDTRTPDNPPAPKQPTYADAQRVGKDIQDKARISSESDRREAANMPKSSEFRKQLLKDADNRDKSSRSTGIPDIPSFKKGGRMKTRGVAKLHKGERAKGRSSHGR